MARERIFTMGTLVDRKIFFKANKPIIVDYDDAIFTKYEKNKNMIARLIMKNKIKMVNRRAELVVAGNKYLKEFARLSGAKRIKIIPTVVDIKDINWKQRKVQIRRSLLDG